MTGMRALLIPVGLDLYAVPLESVREVVAAPRLCCLPTGPAAVLGLFNLRGEIVPLLDTAALIGVGRLTGCPFAAVLRTPLGPAGLAASGLPESTTLGESIGPSDSHGTSGVHAVGQRLAVLIDVEALLTPGRIGGLVLVGSGREETP
jgi:chemotaxis signal transduction protein